jgi:hydroxymethylpyrimidine/phosphomethylpyrimidine kinase
VNPPKALTIAGSDSGGGAGIQADIKTFSALGVYAMSVITAVTAQNTLGVDAIESVSVQMLHAQLASVISDLAPQATKTGMLATAELVEEVATWARKGQLPTLVVDPVLVSTSGHALLEVGGDDAYRHSLLPHAKVATPNLYEAALLAKMTRSDLIDITAMVRCGQKLVELGTTVVVVKGGHLGEGSSHSPDVIVWESGHHVINAERITTKNDHGTGCTLSAAIAAQLARGDEVLEAIISAKSYIAQALAGGAEWNLGAGHGPVDHFFWTRPS